MDLIELRWRRGGVVLLLSFLCFICTGFAVPSEVFARSNPKQVAQWTRFEAQFTSSGRYENPVQEVQLEVDFISPSGKKLTALAFWDGGKTWRVRLSPNEKGKWAFRKRCSREADKGLDAQTGAFTCVPYTGDNPLYRHGAIRVSENGRYFVHADRAPFFWLADTAWNGVMKSSANDWKTYLRDRMAKGFNVVNIMAIPHRACKADADGRTAFTGVERIAIDPAFFQRMDKRMDVTNDRALVVAPLMVHDGGRKEGGSPGLYLPDDQIIIVAQYLIARYDAHHVVWSLTGDGDHGGDRWKKIGRAVFAYSHDRLATMHPGRWEYTDYRKESWYKLICYQSAHSADERSLRWLTEGPPSQEWKIDPPLPVVNYEPNYEAHMNMRSEPRRPFDAHAVRRASYWSLLVAPTCGVAYGAHGIWGWAEKAEFPLDHVATGVAPRWDEALSLPGSISMKHLEELFTSLEWWRLAPDSDLVADQPGKVAADRFIAASRSEAGDLAVVYIPEGGNVTLRMDRMKFPVMAEWFDPATGWRKSAGKVENKGVRQFEVSGLWDSLLILRGIAD